MLNTAKHKISAGGKSKLTLFEKWKATSYKIRIKFKSIGAMKVRLQKEKADRLKGKGRTRTTEVQE